jgi:predicted enzyme related to lactoylglutathione lyase
MQRQSYPSLAAVFLAAALFGCGTGASPSHGANAIGGRDGSGGVNAAGTANGVGGGNGVLGTSGGNANGNGGASAVGGTTGSGGVASALQNGGRQSTTAGGATAATSTAAGAPTTSEGGAATNGAGMSGDGGTDGGAAGTGGATQPPTQPAPTPVTTPYVWGVGIGITDVPAAVKFYTEVMHMNVEQMDVRREDRTETVMVSAEAKRGPRVVLMHFDDMRSTEKITAKLVWQAPNPTAVSLAAASYPGYVSRLTGLIVQFDGPETYIQEVGNAFDSGGAGITVPYLIAMGMSVSDQAASRKFYTTAFGMTEAPTGTFPLTDATGAATVTEYTVQYSTQGGAAIVLQAWAPPRNSMNNPIKVVLFVPDAQAAADKVVAAGGTIFKPAERTPIYQNRKLIVAKDLDGYVLELVE